MRMKNGNELRFRVLEMSDYAILTANGWSLLRIDSSGKSERTDSIGEYIGLNLDKEGRLAIDQPLPKPPVERFRWVFERGGQTCDSAPLSEEEASIMLPENRVKLPWTRKTS